MKFVTLLFILLSISFGQLINNKDKMRSPYFQLNNREVYSDSLKKTVTEIQAIIDYDHLVFNRNDDGTYLSDYDVTLKLVDSENEFIENSFKHKQVKTMSYGETNQRDKKSITRFHLDLKNKTYTAFVLIEDKNSKKSYVNKITFMPTVQAENYSINNLRFYDIDEKTKEKKINHSRIFSDRTGKLLISFRANFNEKIDSILYKVQILSNSQRVYYNTLQLATKKENSDIEIVFEKDFFKESSYKFVLEAIVDTTVIKKDALFSFVWYRSPNTLFEMEDALRQMSYISNRDTIETLIEEKNLEKSKEFFKGTWKKMTTLNSDQEAINLMNEYFKRVNFANKNFGKYSGKNMGWKTDRGRILIKFGQPDEVQRFPFQSDSRAYIVWNYNQARKHFIFVETIHNEYRLTESTRHYEFQ